MDESPEVGLGNESGDNGYGDRCVAFFKDLAIDLVFTPVGAALNKTSWT